MVSQNMAVMGTGKAKQGFVQIRTAAAMKRYALAMHRMVVAMKRAEWLWHCGVQFSAGIAQEKLSNEKAMDGMAQPRQCKEMLRKSIAEWSLGVDTRGKALAKHSTA